MCVCGDLKAFGPTRVECDHAPELATMFPYKELR
jgi:hypothetical protein